MKRTPLTRTAPLRSTSTLTRTSRLAAMSAKRAAANRERRKVLAAMADLHDGICPRCRRERIADGHEVLSRARGGSITDPANIVLIGRACHQWITTHPAAAEIEGWARSAGAA